MKVIRYNNLNLYLQIVEEDLLKNEVKNNLPIGILYSLKGAEGDKTKDLFLAGL